MKTSISDINSFLRCRRAWSFQSPNREALRRAGMPSAALHVGTGVHLGIAEMARGNDWKLPIAEWGYNAQVEFIESYIAQVGCQPSDEELAPYRDSNRLVQGLLSRYEMHYRPNLFGFESLKPIFIEQPFSVEIPGTDGTFVGTWDAILEDSETKDLWIVEHKTYTKKSNLVDLQMSPQFSAYVWAAQHVFPNRRIAGVLYNGLAKKIPTGPELLKSGKLSRAFNENADYMTYIDAIQFWGHDFDEYADILERFKTRDEGFENPYWTRFQLGFSEEHVWQTEVLIHDVYYEMSNPRLSIYPTFRMEGCYDCQVRDLCHATQNGEDVDWLKKTLYIKNEGSSSFKVGREEVEYEAAA